MPDAQINAADTAWLLTATALVLFMTVPGLSIFYGGLVRAKNVLSVLMQCLAITALVTVLWVAYGYSLAFDQLGMRVDANAPATFIGGISKLFLRGVSNAVARRHRARERLRHLPDDLRDHHAGADHRRLRRADEVLRDAVVHALCGSRSCTCRSATWCGAVRAASWRAWA